MANELTVVDSDSVRVVCTDVGDVTEAAITELFGPSSARAYQCGVCTPAYLRVSVARRRSPADREGIYRC